MTIVTQILVFVIIKFSPVMLLWCSINAQSFAHDKSSSIFQFTNNKSRNLPELLKYLSRIVASTFKVDSVGCDGCGG